MQPSWLKADLIFGSSRQRGCCRRYVAAGANALPDSGPRGTAALVLGVIREPMFLLLIAAAGIYLVLSDLHETLMLLFFVGVVMAITFYPSHKTERVLQALRFDQPARCANGHSWGHPLCVDRF